MKAFRLFAILALLALTGPTGYAQPTALPGQPLNYNPRQFPNTRLKIATNGTIHVMSAGDSLMNGGLYPYIYSYFLNNYGFAGTAGPGGQSYMNPGVSASAYITNTTGGTLDTYWYGAYYVLPTNTSATVTFTNVITTNITANVLEVDLIGEPGAGTVKIQTNNAGAGWVDMLTGISCNSNRIVGIPIRVTNAASVPLQMRVTLTSGDTVRVIGGNMCNYTTNGGVIYNDFAVSGANIGQFMSVPESIRGPILRSWRPDLLVYEATDDTSIMDNYLEAFGTFINTYLTNTDIMVIGINPKEDDSTATVSAIEQNKRLLPFCTRNRFAYFDSYALFGSWAQGVKDGTLRTGQDPHPTASGYNYLADAIFDWAGFFDGTKNYFNSPYGTAYVGGSLDLGMGYNQMQGGGNLIIRGPAGMRGGYIAYVTGAGGGTNMVLYETNSPGTSAWVIRDNAGGIDLWRFADDNGTINMSPNSGSFGAPYYIGNPNNSLAPWPPWGIWTTNLSVLGVATNAQGIIVGAGGGLVTNTLIASANLDFPATAPTKTSDLFISVPGILAGSSNDVVTIGVPPVAEITNCYYTAFPSNATVWIRFHNLDTNTSQNPGPAVFKVKVDRW